MQAAKNGLRNESTGLSWRRVASQLSYRTEYRNAFDSSVRSEFVVITDELRCGPAKVIFGLKNQVVEALSSQGSHEARCCCMARTQLGMPKSVAVAA